MIGSNRLYFGDCLEVLREDVADESVDLIYLDPPFNSKRLYNAFIGDAQWVAFDDTWRWSEAIDDFDEVAGDVRFGRTMDGLRLILGEGPNLAYLSYMANRLRECARVLKADGSIYLHCDPTMNYLLRIVMDGAFRPRNFRNEIVWCYPPKGRAPRLGFHKKHDTIFYYGKTKEGLFCHQFTELNANQIRKFSKKDSDGRAYKEFKGRRTYLDQSHGRPVPSWWDDIALAGQSRSEYIGYETQKPIALVGRIIRASCPEGGVVLDPFCGCGTTIHAAQNLNRRWIGIDICVNACKIIEKRLQGHFDGLWDDIEFIGFPKTTDDAKTLASLDSFRFERWAAALTGATEPNVKQRGDGGIDGRGRIPIRKGKFIDVVSQVKGGGTGPGDVQAFNGARQQVGADLGIFTCFRDRVTPKMKDAAASAGKFMDAPVVQIYTVEDYFENRSLKMPRTA